jgi:hypothetical protein
VSFLWEDKMAKRRSRSHPEILSRLVRIESVRPSVSVRADKPRGLPPRRYCQDWLEFHGESDEALKEVRRFVVSVRVVDQDEPGPAQPPSVGAIIQIHPAVDAVIGLAAASFDRLWALAVLGQLRYCWLAFTKPRHRSALIVSARFSQDSEDDMPDNAESAPEAST